METRSLRLSAGRWLMAALLLLAPAGGAAGSDRAATDLLVGEMRKFTLAEPGKPVPEARFKDAAGRDVDLAAFRGKVVLVNLWATWCVPCRQEMPALNRLQQSEGGGDFAVLALAQDRAGSAKVRAFLDELALASLDLYIDTSMRSARALGAVGLPTTILLDRDGREIGRLVGPAEWDSPEAVALIRHFRKERAS